MALVIDLAKPDSCEECRFHRKHMYRENGYMHICDALQRAEQDGTRWLYGSCPILGEIPDKHGDLKDEMDIIHRIEKIVDADLAQDIIGEILASPTIVEANDATGS